jgi:hypothetical protein
LVKKHREREGNGGCDFVVLDFGKKLEKSFRLLVNKNYSSGNHDEFLPGIIEALYNTQLQVSIYWCIY